MDEKPKSKRGFASLSPERRREIASKGGKSVKGENRSFARNKDLAIAAGRKGGQAVLGENRAFSRDRDLAQSAARKGVEQRAIRSKHPGEGQSCEA